MIHVQTISRSTLALWFWAQGLALTAIAFFMALRTGTQLPTAGNASSQDFSWDIGHFLGFALIAGSFYVAARLTQGLWRFETKILVAVLLGCAAIAVSTELGQIFVRDHFPSPLDFWLDICGASVGTFSASLYPGIGTKDDSKRVRAIAIFIIVAGFWNFAVVNNIPNY